MIEPTPLLPGSVIGIVGNGQLGRMLAIAAAKLGFRVHVYGPEHDAPAAQVAAEATVAAYEDAEALAVFAAKVDVATYEFENIPPLTVRILKEAGLLVAPSDAVLAVCQDRHAEKLFLRENGLSTAPFYPIDSLPQLVDALAELQGPAILKTRRFGYDGKGQARINPGDDPSIAFQACGGDALILEGMVEFACEVSQLAARSCDGTMAYYDLPRNVHRDGILRESYVPSGVPQDVADEARTLTQRLMDALDYVGVMAVEYFWTADQGLVANEIAPRVHNTGHWTVEACHTDQFEQHIRAVAGWPLGSPARHSDVVLTNLIGDDARAWRELANTDGLALTLYGKDEIRAGRKMGHTVKLG